MNKSTESIPRVSTMMTTNHDGHNLDSHKPQWPQTMTMMATTTTTTNHDGQRRLVKFVQRYQINLQRRDCTCGGKLHNWASLHCVPTQSVGLNTDHERTLQHILTHEVLIQFDPSNVSRGIMFASCLCVSVSTCAFRTILT